MTQLSAILDPTLLATEVAEGWIREQTHPQWPQLSIFNYTEKTQFERRWNEATRLCRGLIVNTATNEVLARPFPKIHNFDEAEAPRIVDDQVLYHWDNKWDGSLGIAYINPDGDVALATRGSFASDQAIKGTELLYAFAIQDEVRMQIEAGWTPLFEIIYPENRIVLDYGDDEFLAELGSIDMQTGEFRPGRSAKNGKRTMHSVLMDLSRENAEGWVAWLSPWKAVKIKQADYVELHRIVTGLSKKEVWRQLRAGTFDKLMESIPDEFYRAVDDWRSELQAEYAVIHKQARDWFFRLVEEGFTTRKAEALWVQQFVPGGLRGLVFSCLDEKPIQDSIWKMIEPKGNE